MCRLDLCVNCLYSLRGTIESKVGPNPFTPFASHFQPQFGIFQQLANRIGHCGWITHGDYESSFTIDYNFWYATAVGGDHWLCGSHPFNNHLSKRFAESRGMDDYIKVVKYGIDIGTKPGESNNVIQAKTGA